ncbi:hypothetical protein O181_034214 [Austropuccinia psidii MF-1]|uniref:Uncharacterized protein n=1 Tax=Austropuccinia psidii MF-1 TaxID=1389203 RepID=A0A9Q3H9A8_9BASI|nr:hypothetical protein [Austropuccinia psidii MF-1]
MLKKSHCCIYIPEEGVQNDSNFGEKRPSGIYQLQTSSRGVQGQTQQPSEEKKSQEPSGKQQSQSKLAQSLPTRVQDPQIGAFSHGQCVQYGLNSHGIHSQRAGKDEKDLCKQIIQEIQFV